MSQAGLDARRRDGRVLGRDLDRPAVRRAAGDLRLEVHQHALRAGRHDRRPGHPDGAVGDGLHLPPAGAGLPAVRRRAPSSASSPPPSGRASSRPASYEPATGDAIEDEPSRRRRAGRSRRRSRRRPAEKPSATPAAASRRRRGALVDGAAGDACTGKASDAPLCFTCGTKMRPAGAATSARAAAPPAAAAKRRTPKARSARGTGPFALGLPGRPCRSHPRPAAHVAVLILRDPGATRRKPPASLKITRLPGVRPGPLGGAPSKCAVCAAQTRALSRTNRTLCARSEQCQWPVLPFRP